MDGRVEGWMEAKAGLRIAYSNQKLWEKIIFVETCLKSFFDQLLMKRKTKKNQKKNVSFYVFTFRWSHFIHSNSFIFCLLIKTSLYVEYDTKALERPHFCFFNRFRQPHQLSWFHRLGDVEGVGSPSFAFFFKLYRPFRSKLGRLWLMVENKKEKWKFQMPAPGFEEKTSPSQSRYSTIRPRLSQRVRRV